MADNRSVVVRGIALVAIGCQSAFATRADAAITLSFSDLGMSTVVNGEPEAPYAFVSGSITVPELLYIPWSLGPPLLPIEAVSLTISLNGNVIRSFQDPLYFAYVPYINNYGIDELMITSSIALTGYPLDPLVDILSFDLYQGLVSGTFNTIGYMTFQTYQNQEVSYIESAPEVSTWAMMALGLAGVGFMGWREARKTAGHV
jgi:hypothetical protein